ncbi:acetyl-coenzyme-A carboxylase [Rhizophlyctis rosea]|uniref:Acetyl-coenzyme-A carboxylase n=1 Tax=Rhizophlyctis rosea TaxID=64517 RepID=A0AAD5SDP4_9FUNG|nr:acetyl-coenzyme-A carboxylase [Rhizophlyctis rosea]
MTIEFQEVVGESAFSELGANMAASPLSPTSTPTSAPSAVRDFVLRCRGHTPITKVLIANNGMAAVKAIRSIRKWSYETFGDERAIQFTAMCTPEDLKVNAEFVRMADQYVEVPGGTSNHNYANVDLIVDIAERTGVHAVWVGWGFASENPILADKLSTLSPPVVFIGPPASAMRALGDKIASTIVAQSAEVPCVNWSGEGITVDTKDEDGHAYVPEDIYHKATTHNVEEGLAHAERIGFPVMIKASEGGGGKGIRLVDDPEKFNSSFIQVQREVPGSPIFIMQLVRNARHLEIQLLADQYGNAIALFGRDCSTQRRHQKILEEAPITIADQETRTQMEAAAVRLGKLVGYVSAGTVEYLYQPETKKYYFLELNPRLQVEHPTTEMVSGVNIPAAQLQVAMGIPLSCIRDIRIMYGQTPTGTSDIDFDFSDEKSHQIQRKPAPKGHVIAARITAENPDAGFKPNSGKVLDLNFRSNSNVWGYFSVNASGGVHEYADSQFGHIFSYGETRHDARKNLVMALKELTIRGDFRTTTEYLVKILETSTYIDNQVTTGWLDQLIAKKVEIEKPDSILTAICGAVVKAHARFEANVGEYTKALEKGQSPSRALLTTTAPVEFIYQNVQYKITVALSGPEKFVVSVNGSSVEVVAKKLADGGLLVLLDGQKHLVFQLEESHVTHLTLDGKSCLLEKDNDPTKLRSPSPGKLVRYLVEDGAHINAGEAFAEIEVMKMYMPLLATESGAVKFTLPAGSVLNTGDVVGNLQLDDPSRVKRATIFDGEFPTFGPPQVTGEKIHQKYEEVKHNVDSILDGYEYTGEILTLVRQLVDFLRDADLPFFEFSQVLSSVAGRIPGKLDAALHSELDHFREAHEPFPAEILQQHIASAKSSISSDELGPLITNLVPIQQVIDRYSLGLKHHERSVIASLLEQYISVEELFNEKRYEDVLMQLRDSHKNDISHAVAIALAQSKGITRSELVLCLLDLVRADNDDGKVTFLPIVSKLADFKGRTTAKVSLKARELLIYYQLPSYEERHNQTFQVLSSAVKPVRDEQDRVRQTFDYSYLSKLITANHAILDVLPSFFYHEENAIRAAAFYTYILHTYQAYSITSVKQTLDESPVVFQWEFVLRPTNQSSSTALISTKQSGRHSFGSAGKGVVGSFSDLTSLRFDSKTSRKGAMVAFDDLEELERMLPTVVEKYGTPESNGLTSPTTGRRPGSFANVLNVAIKDDAASLSTDDGARARLDEVVKKLGPLLRAKAVRRVTLMVVRENSFPRYFTFKEATDYAEDLVIRHIEPAMAYQLELQRLNNFEVKPCFIDNRRLHIYHAVGKKNPSDIRFFVRAIVYPGQLLSTIRTHDFLVSEGNRILTDIMDALEIVGASYPNTDCNHLFINFIPTFELDLGLIEQSLREFVERHGQRLWKLRVTTAEIRFIRTSKSTGSAKPIRFVISSVTGYVTKVDVYQEVRDGTGVQKLMALSSPPGPSHLQPVGSLYAGKESIQPKRYKAHLMGTTYIYDFPELFRRALEKNWIKYAEATGARVPAVIMNVTELVLSKNDELVETVRDPGSNTCGMVAWDFELFTPEYPEGRHIVVVANDITFNIGSFGPIEDLVFFKASEYARKLGIPRIYISANSGARIGLADEVVNKFNIAWVDPTNPSKGFDYLYLTEENYKSLVADAANPSVSTVREEQPDGEIRHRIVDVIGKSHGIGVENLQGSGMIAGETSKAYEEIFTLTLVTCRSVGIGAYLVRLGQRAIQVEYTPIILTGAAALNKVLGREMYTSNLQLGGTQIMHKNGVSHLVAKDDMEGVHEILRWLSYVPKAKDSPLPVLPSADSTDRDIEAELTKGPYDPRNLLAGYTDDDGDWVSGFFDRESFTETLSGWAKGVIVARARLGGIPVGVISVETRSTETLIWADPADTKSQEQHIAEAGQVWYPNSAYKTAQAINDFNKGEQLPLMIFANWRGFSGGQSDMYKEVLKYGAYIVDALRAYKQPVFIYVVGELRGGAWVVVDPTINPEMMEMYAEDEARGGVLEPEGIVEIKFRKPQLVAAMERLDPKYKQLKTQLSDPATPPEEKKQLQKEFDQREKELLPVFHQAAVHFADLHDKPGRMLAKGVINRAVSWRDSRRYFYWRLLRRVSEESVIKEVLAADSSLVRSTAKAYLQAWFGEDVHKVRAVLGEDDDDFSEPAYNHVNGSGPGTTEAEYRENDIEVVRWLNLRRANVEERIAKMRAHHRIKAIERLVKEDPTAALEGLIGVVKGLDAETKKKVLDTLSK